MHIKRMQSARHRLSPRSTLMIVIFAVFIAETVIMLLMPLAVLPSLGARAIFDALLLIMVIAPVLWHFFIRPLEGYARECERAQENLRQAHEELEATVTQRTAELQSAKAHLQAVFDASPLAIAALDRGQKVTGWNHAAEHLFGWRAEEVIGMPFPLVPPNDRHDFEQLWEKLLGGESVTELQKQRMRRDGSLVEVSLSLAPLRDVSGRIVGVVAMLADISERKRIQNAEHRRLALHEALAHASHILITDAQDAPDRTLAVMGEAVGVDRAYLFRFRERGTKMDNTHEWCAPGTEPAIAMLQDLDSATFPWWMEILQRNGAVVIRDVSALPPEASAEQEILEAQGICSLIAVPLRSGEELLGFVGFDDTRQCRDWPEEDVALLRLLADAIAAYLQRQEAEARVRAANALLKLFTESASQAEYVDSVVALLRDYSGCSAVGLRLLDGEGNIPYVACVGLSREFLASEERISIEKDQCACTRVFASEPEPQDLPCRTPGGSFRCDDIPGFFAGLSGAERERFRGACMRQGFASVAVIPVRSRDRILGAIHLADKLGGRVPPKLAEAIESMGLLVGEALLKFELQEELSLQADELRAMAARLAEVEEAERRQLSRELHDRIGQNLAGLSVNLRVIENLLSSGSVEQAQARIGDCMALLESVSVRIGDVMAELRPPALDDFGLSTALWYFAEQFSRRTGIQVSVKGEEVPERLPSLVEMSLYRIAQEALTNVARHAGAAQATIVLEPCATGVRLSIADNGKGFSIPTRRDPGKPRQCLGLVIMRERAQAIGGLLQVDSEPGKGTRVVVDVSI